MAQGEDIIPIPGTKKIKYLDDNWGALGVQISPEDDKAVRAAIESATITGHRYSPASAAATYMDTPERN